MRSSPTACVAAHTPPPQGTLSQRRSSFLAGAGARPAACARGRHCEIPERTASGMPARTAWAPLPQTTFALPRHSAASAPERSAMEIPSPTKGSMNPAASPASSTSPRTGCGGRKNSGAVATVSIAGDQSRLRRHNSGVPQTPAAVHFPNPAEARTIAQAFSRPLPRAGPRSILAGRNTDRPTRSSLPLRSALSGPPMSLPAIAAKPASWTSARWRRSRTPP